MNFDRTRRIRLDVSLHCQLFDKLRQEVISRMNKTASFQMETCQANYTLLYLVANGLK